jgi:hypothetical protein
MITVASGSLRCCGRVKTKWGKVIGCLKWGWYIHEGKRYCFYHHPELNPKKKSGTLQA